MVASEGGSVVDFDPTIPVTYGQGNVIIDISHGNKISPLNFQLLAGELAKRGVYTGYGDTWEEIEEGLVYDTDEYRKYYLTIPFLRQLKDREKPYYFRTDVP